MTDQATTELLAMGTDIQDMTLDDAKDWMHDWIDRTWTLSSKNVKRKHQRDLQEKKSSKDIQQYCWSCISSGYSNSTK